MAVVGLKLVTLGLLDDSGSLLIGDGGLSDTGILEITDEMLGSKTANITGVEGSQTPVYGNDGQVDVSIGSATPSIAFDFNNLPADAKNKILGRTSDGSGAYVQGKKPRVAVLIQTTEIGTLNAQYIGFASGLCSETAINLQTNTNAESRVDDAITYAALNVSRWNSKPIKFFNSGDTDFTVDGMKADVFQGYVTATTPDTSEG